MKIFGYTLVQIKKTLVALAGFIIAELTVATPFAPETWKPWVLGVIGFLTTALVFVARNTPSGPAEPATPPL